MHMITRVSLALILLAVSEAAAGPRNPGPGSDQVVTLWSEQALTSDGTTSTVSYPIGLDSSIIVDVRIEGAAAGATVTVTPVWERPGGNAIGYPVEHLDIPQATTWTEPTRADFVLTITPCPGASLMYLTGSTTDSDGCTITARAIGR